MLDYFLDKEDGRIGLSVDWEMPDWLRTLLWPDHSFDPEDQDTSLSVYEEAMRDMMEMAAARMINPAPGARVSYILSRPACKDTLFDPALPMDQE